MIVPIKEKMKINFVTSNKNKVKELKQILEPEIAVNHIEMAFPEMRSNSSTEIAEMSAEMLSKKLNKTVVVEDSGLFIGALKDFPGTCSAYIHKRIGLRGILKLMENVEDRRCTYKSAVAYCEPNKKSTNFLGEEKGTISNEIRGNFGFGHDPIFIPENSKKTYGEMEDFAEKKQFRRRAVLKLKGFILKK